MPRPDADMLGKDAIAQANRASLLRFATMLALIVLVTSTSPAGLAPAVFASMTLCTAMMLLLLAAFVRERIWSDHLTRWDEAAAMMGLSLLAGLFVDPGAVQQHLEHLTGEAAPVPSPPSPSGD